jgi:hypothetical protein
VQEKDIDAIIDFSKIGIVLQDKPLIVGGLAMEYRGVRKHGDDIDPIVSITTTIAGLFGCPRRSVPCGSWRHHFERRL